MLFLKVFMTIQWIRLELCKAGVVALDMGDIAIIY